MYYLIYQITNKLNGKIYIGKHITDDKNDDYMGSGKYLKASQQYHGIENFEKKILFECSSEDEMNAKERELVNEEFIAREDTYNITLGGNGGWKYVNEESDYRVGSKNRHNAILKQHVNMSSDDKEELYDKISNSMTNFYNSDNGIKFKEMLRDKAYASGFNKSFLGQHHSAQTIEHLRDRGIKRKHVSTNKFWIVNFITSEEKLVDFLTDELIDDGWIRGRLTSKFKKDIIKNERIKKNEEKILFYTAIYNDYINYSLDFVYIKYNLTEERTSLLHKFKKYAIGYKPFLKKKR